MLLQDIGIAPVTLRTSTLRFKKHQHTYRIRFLLSHPLPAPLHLLSAEIPFYVYFSYIKTAKPWKKVIWPQLIPFQIVTKQTRKQFAVRNIKNRIIHPAAHRNFTQKCKQRLPSANWGHLRSSCKLIRYSGRILAKALGLSDKVNDFECL